METNSNKLIVVLGMHRSGTSVIARGLKVLGAHLGNNLDAAGIDNPKGYWEDLDINALNVEMLNFLKNDWHFLTPIQSEDVDTLHRNGYFLRAVEMLRKKMAQAPIFGFKDPRVAKLLPFWKKIFAHGQFKTYYILAIRHPLSVIKSLAARLKAEGLKGFGRRNLAWMREFYLKFPILHALRAELSWTHYRLLLKVESDGAREFYETESVAGNWSPACR